jgi:uncharacterized protein (TIGR00369 family)
MEGYKNSSNIEGILPWTRSCFVCGENNKRGLHLKSFLKGGKVIIRFSPDETLLGYCHIIHGGIATTLLDEVMTWAAIAHAGNAYVSVEISCRFKIPITKDTKLIIQGWFVEEKRKIVFTEGKIVAEENEDRCFVSATGKYMPMTDSGMALCEKDFVIAKESIHPSTFLNHDCSER